MIDNNLLQQYRKNRIGYTPARTALYVAKRDMRARSLGIPAYPENLELMIDGITITVEVERDPDLDPRDWDCFYSLPVQGFAFDRNCRNYVELNGYNCYAWYYDRKEAIKRAIAENNYPRCSAYQDAARSVDAEIDWWREWLNDDRWYIGAMVTATDGRFIHNDSLWGIEADYTGVWCDSLLDMIDCAVRNIKEQRMDAKRRAQEERDRKKVARLAVKQRIIDSLNGFLDDSLLLAEGV